MKQARGREVTTRQVQLRNGRASATPSFTTASSGLLQRRCACGGIPGPTGECEACRKRRLTLQRRPTDHEAPGAFVEDRFGHDFGRVQVHEAAESAADVNALAYKVGRTVVFGVGRNSLATTVGEKLPAHAIQQEGPDRAADPVQRKGVAPGRAGVSSSRVAGSRSILQRAAVDDLATGDGGGTLPYREATELLECIRIMGQENAAYCRQEVLGEQPMPAAPPPPCSPTGLTRDKYLAQPGTTIDDFGLTTLSGPVTVPAVHTTRTSGGVRLDETDAALPPITSVFTDTDTFTEGTAIFASQGGDCPSGKYPIRWTIFPDGARKIREGELEHCADFRYAFEISLKRYADTVNRLARSGRTFASQRVAEAHVSQLVGARPANWGDIFECLAMKTKRRDGQRGFRGWHTPRPHMIPPRLETRCAFTRAGIGGSSLPEVGQHPPSEIIKDCGEGGAAGGARGAAR